MPITNLINCMMPAFNMFCNRYGYTMPSVEILENLPIYIIQGEELDRFYAAQEILMPYGQKVMDTVTMNNVRNNHGTYTPTADHTIMLFGVEVDTLALGLIHEFSHFIQYYNGVWNNVELLEDQADSIEDMLFDYYDPEEMDDPRRVMLAVSELLLVEGGDIDDL